MHWWTESALVRVEPFVWFDFPLCFPNKASKEAVLCYRWGFLHCPGLYSVLRVLEWWSCTSKAQGHLISLHTSSSTQQRPSKKKKKNLDKWCPFFLLCESFNNTVSDSECFVSSSQGYKNVAYKPNPSAGEYKGELLSGSYIIYLSIPYFRAQLCPPTDTENSGE